MERVHKPTMLWVAPGGENREHKPRKMGEAFWEGWSLVLVACVTRTPAGTTPNFLQCCPHSFLSRRLGTGESGDGRAVAVGPFAPRVPRSPSLPCLAPESTYERARGEGTRALSLPARGAPGEAGQASFPAWCPGS